MSCTNAAVDSDLRCSAWDKLLLLDHDGDGASSLLVIPTWSETFPRGRRPGQRTSAGTLYFDGTARLAGTNPSAANSYTIEARYGQTELTPLWMDTFGCDVDPTYTVPGGGKNPLAGLHPLLNVATALTGLGTVGLMTLLSATALAIPNSPT